MSGYLEVKYPFKSNLGLNPFKSWKKQWCILRPSPTFLGGILAVYCSEAGAAAGTIELPSGFVVRRAKSRTRPHAFAVFPDDEPRKPRVLLAANTLHDAQVWMDKIKALINGNKQLDTEGSLKDSFSVTVTGTELSRKCGLNGADSTVSVSCNGVLISHSQKQGVFLQWKHISDASLSTDNGAKNGTCILSVDSGYIHGGGELHFTSPLANALVAALRRSLDDRSGALASRSLSKSDGDLNKSKCSDIDLGEVRRSSWYSGPSEVSLDDLDLVMSKECKQTPAGGGLSRCRGLQLSATPALLKPDSVRSLLSCDDSMSDRRSLVSVASGIYEEIPELPDAVPPPQSGDDNLYCKMSCDRPLGLFKLFGVQRSILVEEPTYESVAECVYGTMRRPRRHPPPPLPPRGLTPGSKPTGSWRETETAAVTRHGSLGCLPPPPPAPAPLAPGAAPLPPAGPHSSRTLPRWDRSRHAFSAFRKRLKSDSRTVVSPKSETAKDKDMETKKKKFDFTSSRDIFKSFKVSRKMKNLKIASGALTKGETKSCEFLDDTEHVKTNRCSKSVECLEGNDEFLDEFDTDLSIEFDDHTIASLSLPQEIVDLILKTQESFNKIVKDEEYKEGDYMPMSPIAPPPAIEHHYIVMSPRTNMASL